MLSPQWQRTEYMWIGNTINRGKTDDDKVLSRMLESLDCRE